MWIRLTQMGGTMPCVRYMELDEGAGDTPDSNGQAGGTGILLRKGTTAHAERDRNRR